MDKHELDSPSIFQMKPCVLAGETHENGQSNSVFGREMHGAAILARDTQRIKADCLRQCWQEAGAVLPAA